MPKCDTPKETHPMNTITLNIPRLTVEEFWEICQANRDLRLERAATGELIVMSPTTPWTGRQNGDLYGQLWLWNRQTQLGITFDSSTGFTLANGAVRSPDASWVSRARWDALSLSEQRRLSRLCPEFVIELCSLHDSLEDLRPKMQEYIENGIVLGWLVDPKTKQVEVYRPGQAVKRLNSPTQLSGENILPGFVLDLETVW